MGRVLLVLLSLIFGTSAGATAPSGKAIFDGVCAECHEVDEFQGENPNKLAETIGKIVCKEIKHKSTLTLTKEEVAVIASFFASGGK